MEGENLHIQGTRTRAKGIDKTSGRKKEKKFDQKLSNLQIWKWEKGIGIGVKARVYGSGKKSRGET